MGVGQDVLLGLLQVTLVCVPNSAASRSSNIGVIILCSPSIHDKKIGPNVRRPKLGR